MKDFLTFAFGFFTVAYLSGAVKANSLNGCIICSILAVIFAALTKMFFEATKRNGKEE